MLAFHSKAGIVRYDQDHAPRKISLQTGENLRIDNGDFAAAITDGFQPAMLELLAAGKIPALHMTNAIHPTWCDQISHQFTHHPATKREGVTPPIHSLGSHLYSCPKGETLSCYFRNIEDRNSAMATVLPDGYDPIVSFLRAACELQDADLEYLSYNGSMVRHGVLRLWGAGSRPEGGGRCYFAVPHEDYEETNAEHSMLRQIHGSDNVYSMIICIDAVPDKEPETIVWNRRMTLDEIRDPANKHPWANYGFRESLLEGVEALSLRLRKGDAAIIPAHNVHAVVGFPGFRRCTYMAFFHLRKTAATGFSKMIFRT